MTLAERIRHARELAGISQTVLGKAVGRTYGAVSQWENGKHEPELEVLIGVAERCDVNAAWLLNEEGQPRPRTSPRSSVETAALDLINPTIEPASQDERRLPVLPIYEAGGEVVVMGDSPVEEHTVAHGAVVGEEAYVIEVPFDSLSPRLRRGDRIVLNPYRQPARDDIVFCILKGSPPGQRRGYLRIIIHISDTEIVLGQLNPETSLAVPRSAIAATHRVVLIEPR